MKESRRLELQAQLDHAVSTKDSEAADAIRHTIDRETLECTAHTAERLKRVEANVSEIKENVLEIRDEVKTWKARVDGAKMLWGFLKYVAAIGGGAGGALILRALGA